jgi:ubiquinone/menaquinone biosynthesis C-methylase UbiE
MIPAHRRNPFVRGIAQELPFAADSFDTAYATWAYFFPQIGSGDPGLDELERVVRKGGKIAICDNAGSDAFCRLYNLDISSPAVWWEERGFSKDILTTSFDFKTLNDAEELLQFYWDNNGKAEGAEVKQTIEYKIVVYSRFVSRTGRGEREG